jgi:hypothetical protein
MGNVIRFWFYVAFVDGGRIRGKSFPTLQEGRAYLKTRGGHGWLFRRSGGSDWYKSEFVEGK